MITIYNVNLATWIIGAACGIGFALCGVDLARWFADRKQRRREGWR